MGSARGRAHGLLSPARACLDSCERLFVPRLLPGEGPLDPENGVCDGLTYFECYGRLDADLGASAPAAVAWHDGRTLLVQPGKDGAVYLLDAEHLGRLYDKDQAIAFCGTRDDKCLAFWAGSFVTQPVVSEVDGDPVVMVVGFKFDTTHPAGVVAYKVIDRDGDPALSLMWRTPPFDSPDAINRFRVHPGRPVLSRVGGEDMLWVVEVGRAPIRGPGLLWGIRVRDGANIVRQPLLAEGVRYAQPLLADDTLYVNSCRDDATVGGQVEAFRITRGDGPLVTLGDAGSGVLACEPGGQACATDEYCERELGDDCTRPGLCQPKPESCAEDEDEDEDPVCGCDGQDYASTCAAARAGISVHSERPCE